MVYAGKREVVFWAHIIEVCVIQAYSPLIFLFWDDDDVGQPFRVLDDPNKSVLQKIIDLGLNYQMAVRMKAPHFLPDWLGGWGHIEFV